MVARDTWSCSFSAYGLEQPYPLHVLEPTSSLAVITPLTRVLRDVCSRSSLALSTRIKTGRDTARPKHVCAHGCGVLLIFVLLELSGLQMRTYTTFTVWYR
jgi:hypothetical protein